MAKSLSFLGKHQKQRAKSGQDIFSQERPSLHILIFSFTKHGSWHQGQSGSLQWCLSKLAPFCHNQPHSFLRAAKRRKRGGLVQAWETSQRGKPALFTQVFIVISINCSPRCSTVHCHQHQSAFNRFHPSHHRDHTSPASKMDVSGSHISTLMSASTQVILKIDKSKILESPCSFAPPSVFYPILHSCVVLMYPTSTQLCCVVLWWTLRLTRWPRSLMT